MNIFHRRKTSKDSTVTPLSPTNSHSSTSPLSPTTSHSSLKNPEPHKIETISTVNELEQILEDHHHKHVVLFCLPSTHTEPSPHLDDEHKDGEFDAEAWFGHYARLNHMHFVKVEIDKNEELHAKLQPKVKPCWFTFHKGSETGWASGGLKRFVHVHSQRKQSS